MVKNQVENQGLGNDILHSETAIVIWKITLYKTSANMNNVKTKNDQYSKRQILKMTVRPLPVKYV